MGKETWLVKSERCFKGESLTNVVDRFAVAKPSLPCAMRGRMEWLLPSRRLGRDWHGSAVITGGGAGAADFLGHGVEREALGAGDGVLFEVMGPGGEHKQLAVGAGVEVMARGLELLGEAVFKDNDQGKTVRKGGAGDFLFAGADAGRDENRAALGLVEQGLALDGDFIGGEPPRALDLQTVGLVEQKGVAVSGVGSALDFERVEAGEEVGVAANDREPLGVGSNVVDENLKLAAAKENSVVVALGEELGVGYGAMYGASTGPGASTGLGPIGLGLGAADLEAPDDLAEVAGHALANEEKPVEVVGHDGAFDERDLGVEARDMPPAVGDGPAQFAQFDALADQFAENRPAALDFERNHVNAALVVVVVEAAALHRMGFHFEKSLQQGFKRVKEAA